MNIQYLFFFFFFLYIVYAEIPIKQVIFQEKRTPKKIAIIGGGAAGSSTAFWLSNTVGQSIPIDMTIYEKEGRIGGRSTVVPIKDTPSLGHIELGASIFVPVNYNMMNASEKFGFPLKRLTMATKLGIWDGQSFLFEETGNQYWDAMKMIWRYGLAPLKFPSYLQPIIDRFLTIYHQDKPPFSTLSQIVDQLNLTDLVNKTASDHLTSLFGSAFVNEMIQSASRGNYGQDANILHAFAALVSMSAGSGAWSLEDGNYRIFEEFIHRSHNTQLLLNTKVISIDSVYEIDDHNNKIQQYKIHTSLSEVDDELYDIVILASPLHLADIDISCIQSPKEYEREYHTVHVTLIAGYPDPTYFGRTENDVPTSIITTGFPLVDHFENQTSPFTTFTRHMILDNGESVVKMFSSKSISDQDLTSLFVNTSWVYRHAWQAFPKLFPVDQEEWPSIILHGFDQSNTNGGIFYANAFESVISTMETQTLMGQNIAKLIYDHWCTDSLRETCVPFGDGWGTH
ncbi:Prenylcysteine lyase-domain-containing protein [Halteromyces radiatus]|uniref:Prenylcysteine lyase-domain-containing protein n=1 Tax=Halteromyces radiatus TaxID=101107 RepID=UPI00221FCB19|nr:Prenylcysteine lyase-domain-containing protein [Halteromyces radiatus]KAI8080016.1 Prenylcysteine lyase-domain-containing protein [Halteromyces radiatus]